MLRTFHSDFAQICTQLYITSWHKTVKDGTNKTTQHNTVQHGAAHTHTKQSTAQ